MTQAAQAAADPADDAIGTDARIVLSLAMSIAEGVNVDLAPTGRQRGFRLPDGRLVRPQIVFEIDDGASDPRDLTYQETVDLGIDISAYDVEVEIEHEVEEVASDGLLAG